jgi:sugar lactone lactonase YvrE
MITGRRLLLLGAALIAMATPSMASATSLLDDPQAVELASGLGGGSGSTVGPDGALYVTEPIAGRISRVDPTTGEVTRFASGLPPAIFENAGVMVGGAMDVAFIGNTAYVLVTLVGSDLGGSDQVGIYRVDGPHRFTVIADIGAYSMANPPSSPFIVPTGVQYALQPFRGGFLVTDGHHNRVLRVTLDGEIADVIAFGNIVPTGIEVRRNTVYMAQAGPVPHLPENGKIVSFTPQAAVAKLVASGAPLLVDVEFGTARQLYALSQGDFPVGNPEGTPAAPDTGALVRANRDGTLTSVVEALNQPTSLEFIGDTAYIVSFNGSIWKIEDVRG